MNQNQSSLPTATKYGTGTQHLTHGRRFQITIDPDLVLFMEDTAGSMGLTLEQYVQQAVNDALKASYGL